jgi:hypothetical protein
MTNRHERERRGLAWLFAIMASIGVAALLAGRLSQDRYLIGLAVGCLPTGVFGVLGSLLAPRLALARARRP